MGSVGILNVGAGDVKLTFDKDDPVECIRAARIVKDMLRRGYALLVEVEVDGVKKFQRCRDFDDQKFEYIIADLDPTKIEEVAPHEEAEDQAGAGEKIPAEGVRAEDAPQGDRATPKRSYRRRDKSIPAETTRAVAVGRTAGG